MSLPKFDNQKAFSCEGPITETELLNALKSMNNDKSPGNDGLTKEFCETFWNEIKKSTDFFNTTIFRGQSAYNLPKTSYNKTYRKKGKREEIDQKLASDILVKFRYETTV